MVLDRPAVIVALLTPFDAQGGLDEAALREHVDDLVEAGVDALMPCGTTGEGALLSEEEVVEVVRATVAAVRDRVPVLAHVGRPGTTPTLTVARRALDEGAQAVAAVVPYYYPVDDDQIRAHYATLVEGLDGAPVYAYTIPVNTHNELEPALVERLAGDGVAGLKDSTKSLDRHREYAAVARGLGDSFALYDGSASLVLDALGEGSAGAVLAVANVRPELCVALLRAWREGDEQQARRLQEELTAFEDGLERGGPILSELKRATAERLRERGVNYPADLRAPIGSGGRVPVRG